MPYESASWQAPQYLAALKVRASAITLIDRTTTTVHLRVAP